MECIIVNSNATGKMAFLANTVAMFKQVDNGKNDTYIIRAGVEVINVDAWTMKYVQVF